MSGAAFANRGLAPSVCVPLALLVAHVSPSGGEFLRSAGLVAVGMGMVVRGAVVGHVPHQTSGRGPRLVARVLNTDGAYSLVRHPLYLGNLLLWIGIAGFTGAWWFVAAVAGLVTWSTSRTMRAEDRFLEGRFETTYLEWRARTPRLVPRWTRWRPPDLPFSVRTVLRRETTTWSATVLMVTAIEAVRRHAATGAWTLPGVAWAGLGVSLAVWAFTHVLKYRTRVLHVEGR